MNLGGSARNEPLIGIGSAVAGRPYLIAYFAALAGARGNDRLLHPSPPNTALGSGDHAALRITQLVCAGSKST